VKERPIIFNAEMVKAILEGRKTQTRRVIKPQPIIETTGFHEGLKGYQTPFREFFAGGKKIVLRTGDSQKCPYGVPGDKLWVRETWGTWDEKGEYPLYKATPDDRVPCYGKWKSPIYMPKKYSRLTLLVKDVRVERVQDITLDNIHAEGLKLDAVKNTLRAPLGKWPENFVEIEFRKLFAELWDSLNAKRGYEWDVNPFCWVIEFERIE
jgi:hypothetical protein